MFIVFIGGGIGLIGIWFSVLFKVKGYEVMYFSWMAWLDVEFFVFEWDVEVGMIDEAVVVKVDYVINLVGVGIVDCFWIKVWKKLIISSCVQFVVLLVDIF